MLSVKYYKLNTGEKKKQKWLMEMSGRQMPDSYRQYQVSFTVLQFPKHCASSSMIFVCYGQNLCLLINASKRFYLVQYSRHGCTAFLYIATLSQIHVFITVMGGGKSMKNRKQMLSQTHLICAVEQWLNMSRLQCGEQSRGRSHYID